MLTLAASGAAAEGSCVLLLLLQNLSILLRRR
jgi:hypothetical protein